MLGPQARPSLVFPGIGKSPGLRYGESRVYTDVKHSRWRVYRRKGDKVDKAFHWNHYSSPKKCWEDVCVELRRING